jgi:hypothetical protein
MDTERVPRGRTRARHRVGLDKVGLLPAVLLLPIAVGALLTLPRASQLASNSGATVASPETLATGAPAPTISVDLSNGASIDEVIAIYRAQAAKPRFDDSVIGWRIAPYEALVADSIDDRNLHRTCEPYEAGAETSTQLDFTVGYLPPGLKIGPAAEPYKWVCGKEGLSVLYVFNVSGAYGNGQILVERSIQGRRALEMDIPYDSVETGTVNATPTVFVHPADDTSVLGMGRVIVVEDDTGPEFTILSVLSDDAVPFDELIKIAEGIK